MADLGTTCREYIVKEFPCFDQYYIDYLTDMVMYYRNNYNELNSNLTRVVKSAIPQLEENKLEAVIDQICAICQINKSQVEDSSKDIVELKTPICLKDIKISGDSGLNLASSEYFVRTSTVDKKRLELENKRILEKNERRSANPNNSMKSTTESEELSVSQQNMKKVSGVRMNDIKILDFNLSIGSRVLLSNANLTICRKRIYGLIGRNGCGKTTLLNSISNRKLNIPTSISVYQVKQEVVGDDNTVLDTVVASDFQRSFILKEIEALNKELSSPDISDDVKNSNSQKINNLYQQLESLGSESAVPIAASILSGLGFSANAQSRPTKVFSGGWRMRISLAQALFLKPELLLLDEPTNMLDMKSLYWLKSYLPTWDGTVIIVSHDRNFLDSVCSDVIHLNDQQLISYRGNYSSFEKTRKDTFLRQKREYESQNLHRKHVQAFIDRFIAGTRAASVQSRIKALEKLPDLKPPEEEPEVVLKLLEIEKVEKNLVMLDNVTICYEVGKEVLANVTLNIAPCSRISIVGDNGSGKSTLLRAITGELPIQSGTVTPYSKLKIGYLAQHHIDQLPLDKSSLEILSTKFPGKTELEYRSHLGSFGLSGDLALRHVSTLSGGQKTRASLALIAYSRPNLLVLDEPTNHLDIETVEALIQCLKSYQGGLITVTHNEYFVRSTCTDIYECRNHKLKRFKNGFDEYIKNISSKFN